MIASRNGQPNATQRAHRNVAELVAMARDVMADGSVTSAEVHALVGWVADHPEMVNTFPGNVIAQRLERYLADRYIDASEIADLSSVLAELTRATYQPAATVIVAPVIAITQPAPRIHFEGHEFVFAGRFYFGSRKVCEAAVQDRGGRCRDVPTLNTSYVVIGSLERGELEAPLAQRLEAMVAMHENGARLAVISEDHWVAHL